MVSEQSWQFATALSVFCSYAEERSVIPTHDQPSPPTSISPIPPHAWHSPLPPHAVQDNSWPKLPKSSEISFPRVFPLPWQAEHLPSPGESQLGQVWVDMLHLPTLSVILIWFRVTVKTAQHRGEMSQAELPGEVSVFAQDATTSRFRGEVFWHRNSTSSSFTNRNHFR